MSGRISEMTAGDVANLAASTSCVEVSNGVGSAPATFRYSFGNIATWLATVGFVAAGISAALVSAGTFGAGISTPDTGIYSFPAQVGIGTSGITNQALRIAGNITAASGSAIGANAQAMLIAAANNDVLAAYRISALFTPGSFTGCTAQAIRLIAFTTAAFTLPSDPQMIDIGVLTGTGATNGSCIRFAAPVGALNNYLLLLSGAPGTFSVTAAGALTAAGVVTFTNVNVSMANLPTAAGSAGTLWVDTTGGLNIVKRA